MMGGGRCGVVDEKDAVYFFVIIRVCRCVRVLVRVIEWWGVGRVSNRSGSWNCCNSGKFQVWEKLGLLVSL